MLLLLLLLLLLAAACCADVDDVFCACCCPEDREDQFFFELAPDKAIGPRLDRVAIYKSSGVIPDDWHLEGFTLSDITNSKIYIFECNVCVSAPPLLRAPLSFLLCVISRGTSQSAVTGLMRLPMLTSVLPCLVLPQLPNTGVVQQDRGAAQGVEPVRRPRATPEARVRGAAQARWNDGAVPGVPRDPGDAGFPCFRDRQRRPRRVRLGSLRFSRLVPLLDPFIQLLPASSTVT